MPLDPVIAQGFRGIELQNPLDTYARVQQIQSAQQQNQLNALKMQEYQRENAANNALNQAYQAAYNPNTGAYDMNKLRGEVIRGGAGAKLPGIEEGMSKLRTQQFAQGKAETELADAKLKQARSFLDTINPADPNAPQQYIAWHESNHRDPVLGPLLASRGVTADQARGRIMQAIQQGPQAFAQLVTQSKLGTEKFIELNKPTTQVIDQSGQRQVVQIPGLGGAPTTVGTYADVPLPPAVAAQKVTQARAGAPIVDLKVNAYVPASEQAQKDYISAVSDERKSLRTAPDTLKNIDAAKKLIPTASGFMGKGGEPLLAVASFLNNRIGTSINTQGVTDATLLRTRLFEGILDNLKKLDSQPSQEQQRVLAESLGNLGTDPAALGQILDRIGEIVRDRVDRYNVDVSDAENRGVKFPFKPQLKLPGASSVPASIPVAAPAPTTPTAPAAQPIYARNPTTGQRIMSVDGGNNWTPAR